MFCCFSLNSWIFFCSSSRLSSIAIISCSISPAASKLFLCLNSFILLASSSLSLRFFVFSSSSSSFFFSKSETFSSACLSSFPKSCLCFFILFISSLWCSIWVWFFARIIFISSISFVNSIWPLSLPSSIVCLVFLILLFFLDYLSVIYQ